MPEIHPSAIIHPTAKLAHDVVVGPFAIIEENVVIDAGSRVEGHAQVLARSVVGENCSIGRAAIIGGDPQSVAFDIRLPSNVVLGKGNRIREHVTIHRSMYEGKSTVIGDQNFFMAVSHVGHDVAMGSNNIVANNVLFAGHVEVGDCCFFGGASVFHQFIRVGDYAMIQGMGGFSMDIPPYMVGAGVNEIATINVVGLKRAGFDPATRLEIKRAFDLLFRSAKNFTQAVQSAREDTWGQAAEKLIAFVESRGKKGVCPLAHQKSESSH